MMRWQPTMARVFPHGGWRWIIVGNGLLLALAWAVPFFWLAPRAEPGALIPLHYNVHLGVDYAARWFVALWIPAFATAVFAANTVIGMRVRSFSATLDHILRAGALTVAFLVLIAFFFILVANA